MKQNNPTDGRSSKKNEQQRRQAVPPTDAFDNLPQRRPTNPYDKELSERKIPVRGMNSEEMPSRSEQKRRKTNGAKNNSQQSLQNTKKVASPQKQQQGRVDSKSSAKSRVQEGEKKKRDSATSTREKNSGQSLRNSKKSRKPPKAKKKPISSAKRRRNRRITAVVLTFLFIAIGILVSVRLIFKIEKFSVVLPEGEQMIYTEQEVEQAFGGTMGEGLFAFNSKASEEKIETALPYIDTVKIRKKLPNTVEFNITPAHETYYVELSDESGGVAVLSSSLKVLKISDTVPDNTIYLHGAGNVTAVPGTQIVFEDTAKAAALHTILECAAQEGISEVNWIDLNNVGGLSIRIQNRFTIVLGSTVDLNAKLKYAVLLINEPSQSELAPTDAGTLDVSAYPSGNASYRPGNGARW